MTADPRVIVLEEMRQQTALLRQILAALTPKAETIPDRLLDGQYGDPVVKVQPRDWTGESMIGKRFSECPPDWLDLAAEMYDYFASKPDQDEKKRGYNVTDAKRARGWAARLRAGWKPEPQTTAAGEPNW